MSRSCGILLLLLALSPVTAPFSTYDLAQPAGAPGGHGAAFAPKTASGEPAALPGGTAFEPVRFEASTHELPTATAPLGRRSVVPVPLRI